MDGIDRSVQALFGSVGNRFGPSSISCRSGPTPSQKMSVLRIGPDRTETEPRLSIPEIHTFRKIYVNKIEQIWSKDEDFLFIHSDNYVNIRNYLGVIGRFMVRCFW